MADKAQKVINCPNCGAEIAIIDKNCLKVECDYCGSIFDNPLYQESLQKSLKPERVIPFKTTEDDFLKSFYRHLVNTDYVPTDIFEKIKLGKIEKLFLPMYRFNGTFNASWSATEVIRRSRKKSDGTIEYYNEYHPASGVAVGGFHFLYIANENDVLPQGMDIFSSPIDYISEYATSSVAYSDAILNEMEDASAKIYIADVDHHVVWNKQEVYNYLDALASKAARAAAPRERQDFSYSWNSSTSEIELILIPFWSLNYEYEGETYSFIEDGIGCYFQLKHPKDKDEEDKIKWVNKKRVFAIIEAVIFLAIGITACFNVPSSRMTFPIILTTISVIYPLLLWFGYSSEKKALKEFTKRLRNNGLMRFLGNRESVMDIQIDTSSKRRNKQIVAIGTIIMCILTFLTFYEPKRTYERKAENNTLTEETVTAEIKEPTNISIDSTATVTTIVEKIEDEEGVDDYAEPTEKRVEEPIKQDNPSLLSNTPTVICDNYECHFFAGNFSDEKGVYPIMICLIKNYDGTYDTAIFKNMTYGGKIRMTIAFGIDFIRLTGKDGNNDFIMTISPSDNDQWKGEAIDGEKHLSVAIHLTEETFTLASD